MLLWDNFLARRVAIAYWISLISCCLSSWNWWNTAVELWNLKAKCGYIKNVQAIFMKEYKSFEQVYGGPKYMSP